MARTCVLLASLVASTMLFFVAEAQPEAEWLLAHDNARTAVGVAPLTWNTTVAAYALAWAQTQTAKPGCPLDNPPDGIYGVNIEYVMNSLQPTPTTIVRDAWVGAEKASYDYATNTCALGELLMCGHYLQVIWAASTSLGCVSVPCSDVAATYFICCYSPPGNVAGQLPY